MSGLFRGFVHVEPATPVGEAIVARAEAAIEAERQRAMAKSQLPAEADTSGQRPKRPSVTPAVTIPIYKG